MSTGAARHRKRSLVYVLTLAGLALALLWALGAGIPLSALWRAQGLDEWQRLIETGDALATGGTSPVGDLEARSARAAYLLAFHHAQDAEDVGRMLVAADRLERLGELALAHHMRRVALGVATGTAAAQPSAPAEEPQGRSIPRRPP